jgi:hypothetical protein
MSSLLVIVCLFTAYCLLHLLMSSIGDCLFIYCLLHLLMSSLLVIVYLLLAAFAHELAIGDCLFIYCLLLAAFAHELAIGDCLFMAVSYSLSHCLFMRYF